MMYDVQEILSYVYVCNAHNRGAYLLHSATTFECRSSVDEEDPCNLHFHAEIADSIAFACNLEPKTM
jgi:hypothetical protein